MQEQTGTGCLITPCLAPSFGNSVVFVSPLKSPVLPPFSRESHFHVSCHWRSSIDSLQALSLQYALYTYRDPGLKLGYSMDTWCAGKGSRCSLCAGCSRVCLYSPCRLTATTQIHGRSILTRSAMVPVLPRGSGSRLVLSYSYSPSLIRLTSY